MTVVEQIDAFKKVALDTHRPDLFIRADVIAASIGKSISDNEGRTKLERLESKLNRTETCRSLTVIHELPVNQINELEARTILADALWRERFPTADQQKRRKALLRRIRQLNPEAPPIVIKNDATNNLAELMKTGAIKPGDCIFLTAKVESEAVMAYDRTLIEKGDTVVFTGLEYDNTMAGLERTNGEMFPNSPVKHYSMWLGFLCNASAIVLPAGEA